MDDHELLPQLESCDKCDLCDQGDGVPKNVGISSRLFEGSQVPSQQTSMVLYVGRNPGYNEDLEAQCFVGKSGHYLTKGYIEGSTTHLHASVYLTNGVRCYTVGNDPPKARHYNACLDHTIQDLSLLLHLHREAPHHIVVLLGGDVCGQFWKRVFGVKGMSLKKAFQRNGERMQLPATLSSGLEVTRFNLFATYHPAGVMRDRNLRLAVHSHQGLILDCLQGVMAQPSDPEVIPSRIPRP